MKITGREREEYGLVCAGEGVQTSLFQHTGRCKKFENKFSNIDWYAR